MLKKKLYYYCLISKTKNKDLNQIFSLDFLVKIISNEV